MADTPDLGSGAVRCGGSSPLGRTNTLKEFNSMTKAIIGETGISLESAKTTQKKISLREFLNLQKEEILKFRWIESEKAKKDLTGVAEIDWVNQYAESFREYIEDIYGKIE